MSCSYDGLGGLDISLDLLLILLLISQHLSQSSLDLSPSSLDLSQSLSIVTRSLSIATLDSSIDLLSSRATTEKAVNCELSDQNPVLFPPFDLCRFKSKSPSPLPVQIKSLISSAASNLNKVYVPPPSI
ncbi:hypothetical protein F2Q69_00010487 [Brassica cretica]|uniref:Uncharacterized protein n=1 Tax=Brassica cretica TaxID=69181 RepID=A0A8S9QUV7_BRACR|nr:hypothetical protein F2Q69_00010487 [Brassica cretica]